MKQFFLLVSIFACVSFSFAQKGIIGKWKTIDDETGKAVSIVEVFESHGRIYGKVIEILSAKDRTKTCTKCEGDDRNKPIMGLIVIKGLKKDGD